MEAQRVIGSRRFKIVPGHWYGWQMLPGYGSRPYYSPIRMKHFAVAESQSALDLAFHNLCYARGVRDFEIKLTNVFWTDELLSGTIDYGDPIPSRLGIVTRVTPQWICDLCKGIGSEFQSFDGAEQDLFDQLDSIANRNEYG
jgi:hypothetical protein